MNSRSIISITAINLLLFVSVNCSKSTSVEKDAAIAASTATPDTPLVLQTPVYDDGQVFLLTYFNQEGCQPATTENPAGLHKGIDFAGPKGTVIHAAAAGKITDIQNMSGTSAKGHTVVLQSVGGGYTLIYNFEPALSISVTTGQMLQAGDIIGSLDDDGLVIGTGIKKNDITGYGILDFRLMDSSGTHLCWIPKVDSGFKLLVEELFIRAWYITAEYPGPCTCHYSFP